MFLELIQATDLHKWPIWDVLGCAHQWSQGNGNFWVAEQPFLP